MIHSWEQKNRKNRMQANFSAELSDEQIAQMIAEVEAKEMLPAPRHLKANVLEKVARQKKAERERRLLSYRTQVLVTVAASLAVLILLPAQGQGSGRYQELQRQAYQLREEAADSSWERYQRQEEQKWQSDESDSLQNVIEKILKQGGSNDEEKEE